MLWQVESHPKVNPISEEGYCLGWAVQQAAYNITLACNANRALLVMWADKVSATATRQEVVSLWFCASGEGDPISGLDNPGV